MRYIVFLLLLSPRFFFFFFFLIYFLKSETFFLIYFMYHRLNLLVLLEREVDPSSSTTSSSSSSLSSLSILYISRLNLSRSSDSLRLGIKNGNTQNVCVIFLTSLAAFLHLRSDLLKEKRKTTIQQFFVYSYTHTIIFISYATLLRTIT